MNTRTTVFLAFFLVVLLGLYAVRSRRGAEEPASPLPVPKVTTTRDLLEDKPLDVVKVVVKRQGDDADWVFEKEEAPEGGSHSWRMTAPLSMPCVRWEVDKFGNQLRNLRYDISYQPGEPGAVTAADAGLDPPRAVITLIEKDGKETSVEIGKPASDRQTYVRLAGSEEVCLGNSPLRGLIKDRPLEYREKQVWTFDAADATRVEIDDRTEGAESSSYVFLKDGRKWMMAAPVTAPATDKVGEMVSAMSRLRAIDWVDDRPERLAGYGVESPSWTVRVTVEKEIEAEDEPTDDESDEEEEAPPEPVIETKTYALHLSNQSPIGETTRVYMRVGDEPVVGTLMKTVADRFKPAMAEWRDMHVTTLDVNAATRIDLTTPAGSAVLAKKGNEWTFEADGGLAEVSAVTDLLGALSKLTAVAFVDDASRQAAEFGFDNPRFEVNLTIPGVVRGVRIVVGDYTDGTSRRLVYVGQGDLTSVAKVRAADVETLTQPPATYRDRAIVGVLPSRFERIVIERENPVLGDRMEFTLTRDGNNWRVTEPVSAAVNQMQMDKLVEALGGLRATRVVAEDSQASAYGLHDPAVTLTLVYRPVSADEDGGVDAATRSIQLLATAHDGKHYLRRSDRGTIYEIALASYQELLAEYREDRVLSFDEEDVTRFSIRNAQVTHDFVRQDGKWVYEAEPDLPLDDGKVDNLLLQVRDLRTNRYATYQMSDAGRFGLDEPAHAVAVTLGDGSVLGIKISAQQVSSGKDRGVFARLAGDDSVFVLGQDSVQRIRVALDQLESTP